MTVRYRQPTFDAGEISPHIHGRVDLEKRAAGVGVMQNFLCLAHGPVVRRPGFEYIAELKDSAELGRLIPFEFSVDDAYMIVANGERFRFYRDGAVIVKTATDTSAWVALTVYAEGDYVKTGSTIYVCHTAHTSSAAGAAGDEPGVGANWATYWSQDDTYEVVMTYDEEEIQDLDTAQSADTLYLAHEDHAQRTLARAGHNDWTLADITYTDGPFINANTTTTTLTPSGTTGSITITASAATGINGGLGFLATDVGRLVAISADSGSTYGIARITVRTSAVLVSATVLSTLGGTAAYTHWKLGYWSTTTGYPRTVTFAFDRLCWAGSTNYPQYNWLSRVSEYTSHADDSTLTDASALNLPFSAGKINAIRWTRFARRLTVGTGGAEWWMTDATGDGPITAESKQAIPASGNGCAQVFPVEIGSIVVYLQRHGRVVRELYYDFENDAFGGAELTVLAEHLTRDYGITRMAFQRTPYRVLWCVREDGALLGCTYYRDHKVTGWHVHITEGYFEDVAVIPGDGRDEVWVIVQRTVDGSTVRYVERMAEEFTGGDTTDAFFVDAGLTLDNRQDISSINLTTDVVTVTSHGLSNGNSIRFRVQDDPDASEGDEGSLHMQEFTVSDATAHTFKCKDDAGSYVDFSDYTTIWSAGTNTIAKNVTSISGLDHLEGESVDVLADGIDVGAHTVSSGAITLSDSASVVHVGLGFVSDLWTLTPDIPLPLGSSMSVKKRVTAATVQFYNTLGAQIGTTVDNLKDQQFAADTVPAGQAADLFSGEWPVQLKDADDTNARIYIRQNQPLPMMILAVESDIEVEEVED